MEEEAVHTQANRKKSGGIIHSMADRKWIGEVYNTVDRKQWRSAQHDGQEAEWNHQITADKKWENRTDHNIACKNSIYNGEQKTMKPK